MSAKLLGPVCGCDECHAFGVGTEPQRLVPSAAHFGGSRLIHGRELSAWHKAKSETLSALRRAVGARGRHASGFERLSLLDEAEA